MGFAAFFGVTIGLSGCTQNVREQSPEAIAQSVTHLPSTPDRTGLTWFGPELHVSHYRTLFYVYDTVDYRLGAQERYQSNANDSLILLINARYGGDNRHYEFAMMPNTSNRELNHRQHEAERCQIFNSLISSCLYRDRFSLSFTKAELELARDTGIQFTLASKTQAYEQLDLPPNYIRGFLNAIGRQPE